MPRILSVIFFLFLSGVAVQHIDGQNQSKLAACKPGKQAPPIGFSKWAPNTRVWVYVRAGDFNSEQLPSLLAALKNWNLVADQTGSGVKFEYQGTILQENRCDNCMTIMRGDIYDEVKRHATEVRAYSAKRDQIITYAQIVVDPLLTNPQALLNAMVHELGHNLGLRDCYTCKSNSTVMTQFESANVPNGMEQPTFCDLAQVAQVYRELRPKVERGKLVVVDEGEEPEDDDTPVVVPPKF